MLPRHLKRVKDSYARLGDGWVADQADPAAARGILTALRESTPEEACSDVEARLIQGKASAGAVWDAVHLASIHAVTSASALHYAFLAAPDPRIRFLLLLQAAAWVCQFRKAAGDNLRPFAITDLEPAEEAPIDKAIAETFAGIAKAPDIAAGRVFRLSQEPAGRQAFLASALRFTASRVSEVHYYEFLAALLEDVPLVSAEWQPHVLASAVYYLKGPGDPEPVAMKRARDALLALAS